MGARMQGIQRHAGSAGCGLRSRRARAHRAARRPPSMTRPSSSGPTRTIACTRTRNHARIGLDAMHVAGGHEIQAVAREADDFGLDRRAIAGQHFAAIADSLPGSRVASSVRPIMRVSCPSTGGGGRIRRVRMDRCELLVPRRRPWRSAVMIRPPRAALRVHRRAAPPVASVQTRLDARIDLREVRYARGSRRAKARDHRRWTRPASDRRHCEAFAHQRGILGMQQHAHSARAGRQQGDGVAHDADDLGGFGAQLTPQQSRARSRSRASRSVRAPGHRAAPADVTSASQRGLQCSVSARRVPRRRDVDFLLGRRESRSACPRLRPRARHAARPRRTRRPSGHCAAPLRHDHRSAGALQGEHRDLRH